MSEKIEPVQGLRAVAALAVVLAHALGDLGARGGLPTPSFATGAAGVDLFFVISGFVMVYASRSLLGRPGAWAQFLARRVARVVPLYWAVTLVYLLVQLGQGKWYLLDAGWIAGSLAFVPVPGPGGDLSPFYGIGWTLNFEMMFYIVFALCLAVPFWRPEFLVSSLLIAAVALGSLIPLPRVLAYLTNPIVLDFVLGVAIATAYLAQVRLSPRAGWALVAGGVLALALVATTGYVAPLPDQRPDLPRWVAWGLPGAAIMAGCVLAPLRWPSLVAGRSQAFGDASYAIYLTHPLVIIAIRPIVMPLRSMVGDVPAALICLGIIFVGVIVISLVLHQWLELPAKRAVTKALLGGMPASLGPKEMAQRRFTEADAFATGAGLRGDREQIHDTEDGLEPRLPDRR